MFTLIAENKYGEQLDITNTDAYTISSVDGLDPADAVINTSHNAGYDGTVYTGSYVDSRQIIITLAINKPAEQNRIALYQYFKAKFPVRLYYRNGERDVYIDGYVQSFQIGFFDKKQTAQIVIYCPQPYFRDTETTAQEFAPSVALFEFPFSIPAAGVPFSELSEQQGVIINGGDVETGMLIEIVADRGNVGAITIHDEDTGEYFKLNLSVPRFSVIEINTKKGEKSIKVTSPTGQTINGLRSIGDGSTWLQLRTGRNKIGITAEDGTAANLTARFVVDNCYEGV